MPQQTLTKPITVEGLGLHSGEHAAVTLRPADENTGLLFRQNGRDTKAAATLSCPAPLCTKLEAPHLNLSTVEHLLAALHALNVDNVIIECNGTEVPILDGSALPWVQAIDEAGRTLQTAPRNWLTLGTVTHGEGAQTATTSATDHPGLSLEVHVDFNHPLVGKQVWNGFVDEQTFRTEIAPTRTFVLEADIAAAKAAGLVKGGSLENALVFGTDGTIKTPGGARFPNEPVRHKALDLIGDLYLAGLPLSGHITTHRPGHTFNNALLRKLVTA
jgi:UDP-3-O-[3-hydroxymyristoyl] N-acetylglucosamine deacetylase